MSTLAPKIVTDCESDKEQKGIAKAAEIIRNGGLVAFPTETVYGLGANVFNADAVERIYKVKGRPADNPLIAHISDLNGLDVLVKSVPPIAKKLADAFWPGPLTIIFEKKDDIPLCVTGGRNTIAVRFPSNSVARELIRLAGVPIAAPSANVSGRPSSTEPDHVVQDFFEKIDMVLYAGATQYGLESTIVDITGSRGSEIEVLRPGSITKEMLLSVSDSVSCAYETEHDEAPRAPGMKYKHYAPAAKMFLVIDKNNNPEAIANKIISLAEEANKNCISFPKQDWRIAIMATEQTTNMYDDKKYMVLSMGDRNDPEAIAARIYSKLRLSDGLSAEHIYCEGFNEDGVFAAVMDRLKKACGGNIIVV